MKVLDVYKFIWCNMLRVSWASWCGLEGIVTITNADVFMDGSRGKASSFGWEDFKDFRICMEGERGDGRLATLGRSIDLIQDILL